MNAPDFSDWNEQWPDTPTLRRLERPHPVFVEMCRALPLARKSKRADRIALRVRSGGLRLEGVMRAELHAWVRLVDDQWLGCVCLPARTGDGKTGLDLWLWVPADALSLVQEL